MSVEVTNALVISRRNIACIASLLIETICSLTRKPLDESCEEVVDLLCALHRVFFHGFKYKWSKLAKSSHPWRLISAYSSEDQSGCVELVKLLEGLQDDSSKLLAWIKTLLLKRCLIYGIDFVRRTCSTFRDYYYPGALLFSEDLDRILASARCLGDIDFNFDLKDKHVNSRILLPINYAAYLRPYVTRNAGICDESPEVLVSTDHTNSAFLNLREAYTALLKNCRTLEEKLTKQDSKLERYEMELCSLRRLRQELESQVLELQIQVTLYHEECSRKLLEAGLNWSVHRPPTVSLWESIRHRRQRLVVMAESASAKSLAATSAIRAPQCDYSLPSLLVVDQGIDALQLNADTCEKDSSFDRPLHHRPHSMHVAPEHSVTPEIGQEPNSVDYRHETDRYSRPTDFHSKEACNHLDHSSESLPNRSWTSLYITPSYISEGALFSHEGSMTSYGLQKMPKASEYFLLPNLPDSHSDSHRKSLCDLIDPAVTDRLNIFSESRLSKDSELSTTLARHTDFGNGKPFSHTPHNPAV